MPKFIILFLLYLLIHFRIEIQFLLSQMFPFCLSIYPADISLDNLIMKQRKEKKTRRPREDQFNCMFLNKRRIEAHIKHSNPVISHHPHTLTAVSSESFIAVFVSSVESVLSRQTAPPLNQSDGLFAEYLSLLQYTYLLICSAPSVSRENTLKALLPMSETY